jgi:DNA-binding MarR family transcriptional regulator
MTKRELALGAALYPPGEDLPELPVTRAECKDGPRPCPWVSCSANLYLDVSSNGNLTLNFPDLEPDEMAPEGSCALDVADRGGSTLEDVAAVLNLTRERIRQVEVKALAKLVDADVDDVLGELAADAFGDGILGKRLRGAGDEAEREPAEEDSGIAAKIEREEREEREERGLSTSLFKLLDKAPALEAPPVRHVMVTADGRRVGDPAPGPLFRRASGLGPAGAAPWMSRILAKKGGVSGERRAVPTRVQWFGEDGEECAPRELPPLRPGTAQRPVTEAQRDVLRVYSQDKSSRQIAAELGRTRSSVEAALRGLRERGLAPKRPKVASERSRPRTEAKARVEENVQAERIERVEVTREAEEALAKEVKDMGQIRKRGALQEQFQEHIRAHGPATIDQFVEAFGKGDKDKERANFSVALHRLLKKGAMRKVDGAWHLGVGEGKAALPRSKPIVVARPTKLTPARASQRDGDGDLDDVAVAAFFRRKLEALDARRAKIVMVLETLEEGIATPS